MNILALALCLAVQEKPLTTTAETTDTVKVTVSGRVDLDYANRSKEMTAYTRSESNPTGAGAPGASEDENTFEGHLAIRFDISVGAASAIVEIGTKRIDNNLFDRWGDGSASQVLLREALLVLPDLLFEGLTAEIGISRWTFDVRGKGSPFAFDMRHSSTITRNIDSLAGVDGAGAEEQGDARLIEAAFPDELMPVGAVLIYRADKVRVDIVVLPAIIEEGSSSLDEALYAVDFFYSLDETGSRIAAIIAASSFGHNTVATLGDHTDMITAGIGLVIRDMLLKGLELYGEAYFQFGGAGEADFTALGGIDDEELDAKGRAFQVGFEYTHVLGNPLPVWFGVNFTQYSGDDDTLTDRDTDVDRFASYEGINDLLILENMYFGFDIDSNYTVIKINVGSRFSLAREHDLEVNALVGIAEQTEDSQIGAIEEGELGNEVDVRATWAVTKQFSMKAALGLLFGSDLLEESMRASGPAGADQAEDNAWLWYMGFDLKF